MTRMFRSISRTWNPVPGCLHDCTYCWARELALTRLKNTPRYKEGFAPQLIEKELKRSFKPGEFVFVCSMGDLFQDAVPTEWIIEVLKVISRFPKTKFLLQTKNPRRFHEFRVGTFLPNIYLGTTIETNRSHHVKKVPTPYQRFRYLTGYPHGLKFLSVEPIMDFDLDILAHWMALMKPRIIEVGADNHGHHLPEPPWDKVQALLMRLREICPDVKEKDGLERLRKP